ncbi:hypothetical protein SSP531S_39720 [Streptomyces spongiicola]|uniref:Uncharacterized protein n=1 Tax=Streptomyces spongiicola TaxID=1690221 RepID=A0A388T0Q3_9ACTN|nr:hypothetical protein SSP531S_39720 [Streptomyces spongiicola]
MPEHAGRGGSHARPLASVPGFSAGRTAPAPPSPRTGGIGAIRPDAFIPQWALRGARAFAPGSIAR